LSTESVPTTHELSAQGWADGLEAEVLRKISVTGFVAKRASALIQQREFLERNPGYQETIGLRRQSDRAPRTSGQPVENNEQVLNKYQMVFTINEYADAYRWDNVMSRQYVTYDNRDEAKANLADQMANAWDRGFFNQIAGNADPGGAATFQGNNPIVAPDANHWLFAGNATSEATIDASDVLTLDDISEAVTLAKVGTVPIRPVEVKGFPQPMYVVFIHPWQSYLMKLADTRWDNIARDAMQGGNISGNPRLTGGMGVWDGTLICENYRVPASATAGSGGEVVRRAILCGSQSAICGYARLGGTALRYRWVEKLFDYDREMGCMAGFIGGLRKSVWTQEASGGSEVFDFSTVVISSASHASDNGL
jgi:N4-gp56 family major capsid protein